MVKVNDIERNRPPRVLILLDQNKKESDVNLKKTLED